MRRMTAWPFVGEEVGIERGSVLVDTPGGVTAHTVSLWLICLLVLPWLAGGATGPGDSRGHRTGTVNAFCGANCLYALDCLLGRSEAGIADIARECGFTWDRCISLLAMKNYLVRRSYGVRAEKIDVGEICRGFYCIIPVRYAGAAQYNHYFLLMSEDKGTVVYYDGNGKVLRCGVDELGVLWDGECLLVAKQGVSGAKG